MKHPIDLKSAEPVGLFGVTEIVVRFHEPHVVVLMVVARRAIYFSETSTNVSADGSVSELTERGDHGTGRLRLTKAGPYEGFHQIIFGQPVFQEFGDEDHRYTTSLVLLGLDVADLGRDPRRTLWKAT